MHQIQSIHASLSLHLYNDSIFIYLHCVRLLGTLEVDNTEEQGILGTVK